MKKKKLKLLEYRGKYIDLKCSECGVVIGKKLLFTLTFAFFDCPYCYGFYEGQGKPMQLKPLTNFGFRR